MNSQLIELSCINAREKVSNAEWTTNLQKPFYLNPGDTITVRQSIIDANLSGEYTNINIASDIDVSIEYGYYYVNDGQDLTYGNNIINSTPFGFYIARQNDGSLFRNTKTFKIPAGNYSAPALAEFVSSAISKIPAYETYDQYISLPGNLLTVFENNLSIGGQSFKSSEFGFNSITSVTPLTQPQIDAFVPTTPIYVYWRDNNSKLQKTSNIVESRNGNVINFVNDIPFLEEDNTITDITVVLQTPQTLRCYNEFGGNTDWIEGTNPPRFIGTNQFALEYNINNSGKFQFSIFHTSPYTSDTDSDPSINVMQFNGAGDLFFQDTRTGIFFTQLEPASLWRDILGFNLSNLIVVDNPTEKTLVTKLTRGKNITSNYIGADTLIGSTRSLAKIATAPYNYKTTLTNPIIADNVFISQDIGYCLVEISAIPTDYNGELGGLKSGVIQICSNAYDNNGFITSYAESSLFFINNSGIQTQYGSFRIRILNPRDYTPVKTLGPRSTVFLEIVNAK